MCTMIYILSIGEIMENKFLNTIIAFLVLALLGLGLMFYKTSNHGYFAFTVEESGNTKEIGRYVTYRQCVEENKFYHNNRISSEFNYEDSTCEWISAE